jgi:hypothetical protein
MDDAGPSRLASALASAQADLGSAADLARMRAKLAPHIAQASIDGAGVVQGGAASAAGKAVLVVVGTLVLSGVAWLAFGATTSGIEPVRPRRPIEATGPVLPAHAELPAGAAAPAPAQASTTDTSREPHSAAAPARSARSARKARPPQPPAAPPASVTSDVQGELELLRRAQDAIDTRPRAALDALDEHAQAYPEGVFAQERESLAIDALRKLGRRQDAIARAHVFLARHPSSPHVRRLVSWLQSVTEGSKTDADRLPVP